jgi:hypothetical protein
MKMLSSDATDKLLRPSIHTPAVLFASSYYPILIGPLHTGSTVLRSEQRISTEFASD